tara:strand:- start:8722 stop:9840 length:1119 start_codon:yes stop_codon:yes gene_type:complete
MKIIYLIHSLKNSGGMERVITVKANLLAEYSDVNVEIITYSDSKQSFYKISEKVNVINFSGVGTGRKKTFEDIIDYINNSSVDVLISTGGKDIAISNKINNNIYKILEVHFCFKFPVLREISLKRNSLFVLIGYLKILRNIYFARKFNLVVALTQRDAALWKKYSRINSLALANPSSFAIHEKEIDNTKSDIIQFISVGRLNEQKDFNSLLLACSDLKNTLKIDNWKLEIYGDGDLREDLNNQIKAMKLDNHITIKKAVSNIEDIYSKSDFLLMTSIYEGLPMVLIEAMTFGIPCISFDCESGPAELIDNGFNGYLIKNRNVKQFSKMMARCVAMEQKEYLQFSTNAFNCSREYSQNLIVEQWHKIFLESKR